MLRPRACPCRPTSGQGAVERGGLSLGLLVPFDCLEAAGDLVLVHLLQLRERALFAALDQAEAANTPAMKAEDFPAAMQAMAQLRAPIDAFFDNVMVMDKDETIRENRLALLRSVDAVIRDVADFTKIVSA